MSHADDDGATASDVEGPLYVDDPPWREKPVRVYEDYEGMGDADVLFVRGSVTVGRRHAAARRGHRHLADRARRRLRHLGRAPAGVQLPRALEGRGARTAPTSSRRCCRSPTRCRPTGRSGATSRRSASTRGGRRTSTSRSTRRATQPLVTQVFFPDDPYLENDTIGAVKPALVRPGRARGRPPGLPVRHRAAAGGVSRFASCSLGERRFAALVEGDVVRPLRGVVGARRARRRLEVLADPPLTDETRAARRRDAAARRARARARSSASG